MDVPMENHEAHPMGDPAVGKHGECSVQPLAKLNIPPDRQLSIVQGDLTLVAVDAIVNAANAYLVHGGGVAGAIVRRGGEIIQEESDAWVREHGPIRCDRPAITTAGKLPCRFVIHAVGPVWGEGEEDAKLHAAVTHALRLAEQHGLQSIALPAISTGIFRFPVRRAANLILGAVLEFLEDHPACSLTRVLVVLFDSESAAVFLESLTALKHRMQTQHD